MRVEMTVGKEKLVYEENFWTGRRKLSYGGKQLKRINNKKFVLESQNGEGGELVFEVKGNMFKGISVQSTAFPEPVIIKGALSVLDYILVILPIVPSVFFGAIGGGIGGAFTAISLVFVPKIKPKWLKIIIGIEMCVISGLTAFLAAFGVGQLLL